MVDRLAAAADEPPADAPLTEVLAAIIRVTVAHRASGGLYRWEARYLERDDRRRLRTRFEHVVARMTEVVRRDTRCPTSACGRWRRSARSARSRCTTPRSPSAG